MNDNPKPQEPTQDVQPGFADGGLPECGMCDDGWIMLSDAGPGEWGEDCFCEVYRPIECPECRDRRRYEAQKAKRPNARITDAEVSHEKAKI